MYGDTTDMQTKLMAAKSNFQRTRGIQDDTLDDKEKALRLDHISTRLVTGQYYTMTKAIDQANDAAEIKLYFRLFANIQNEDRMFNVFAFWERMPLDQIMMNCGHYTYSSRSRMVNQ